MTDANLASSNSVPESAFTPNPTKLNRWQGSEPYHKYLFIVKITNTDPENLACEVYRFEGSQYSQRLTADIDFKPAIDGTAGVHQDNLDLKLDSDSPSLVIFYLNEDDSVFRHELYNDHDPSNVIQKTTGESDLIYNARWLRDPANRSREATDKKAVSVIMRGQKSDVADAEVSYGLRVYMPRSFINIDPKIDNDGEGGPLLDT